MTTRRQHTQWTDWLILALCIGIFGCTLSQMTLHESVKVLVFVAVAFPSAVLIWQHGFWKGKEHE